MFRGILFLDSEETLNLPLTTTKKGVDATSEVYKALLPIMKNAMIKVFEFLKKIPKMGDEANDYRQTLCETFQIILRSSFMHQNWIWILFQGKSNMFGLHMMQTKI